MNYLVIAISMIFLGCNVSNKITETTPNGKFIYYSGNISGLDNIIVHKIISGEKKYSLTVDCNHYITGIGKTIFIKRTLYQTDSKDYSTWFLIKDNSMQSALNLPQFGNNFLKLSDEEYEVIKKSFTKYPMLTAKYSLNADSLKNYLGWLEVKK